MSWQIHNPRGDAKMKRYALPPGKASSHAPIQRHAYNLFFARQTHVTPPLQRSSERRRPHAEQCSAPVLAPDVTRGAPRKKGAHRFPCSSRHGLRTSAWAPSLSRYRAATWMQARPSRRKRHAAAPSPSSHPDAGRTTLTEKLLLFAGAIHIAGSVKARKAPGGAAPDRSRRPPARA